MTDRGQTGPDQGQGAKYLILPPGSPDMNPAGYIVVHSPTNQVWFGGRELDPDKAAAAATLRQHRLYPWADRDAAPETPFVPRILGLGQVCLETSKDKAGTWLDGGKTYRMRVKADPPVKQFWSITLYDNLTRGPVITDAGSSDLSSRKPDLVTNADGSVDVDFGPAKPEGATNFIKTNAGQGWLPYFRFYGSKEAYFDKPWQLNDIALVVQ